MGKSSSAPPAPDYASLIPQQTAANKDMFNYALNAMRVNTATPWGSQTWSQTPTFNQAGYDQAVSDWQARQPTGGTQQVLNPSYNPARGGQEEYVNVPGSGSPVGQMPSRDQFTSTAWSLNQQLSPDQQRLFDSDMQSKLGMSGLLGNLTGRVGEATANPLDFSSVPGMTTGTTQDRISQVLAQLQGMKPGEFSQRAGDAAYSQATRYLQPEQQQARTALETRLAEQGFVPGTPAYNQAMESLNKTQDMSLADARDRAVLMGFGIGGQDFDRMRGNLGQQGGLALQGGVFGNQARQQQISEMLTQRQYPLNELNALRAGTQVQLPQMQAQYGAPNLQAPDMLGAAQMGYQNQLGAWNAGQASNDALMGGLFSLGGAAMGAPWFGPLMGMATKG